MTTENDGANAPPDVRAETPEGGGPEVSPLTLERARHDRRIAERDRVAAEDSARYWREMYERVRNNAETAMQRDHALMTERMELATKLFWAENRRDECVEQALAEFRQGFADATNRANKATEYAEQLEKERDEARAEVERLKGCLRSPGFFGEQAAEFEARLAGAVAAEREACAKVAESYEPECEACPRGCAAAIRARGGGK